MGGGVISTQTFVLIELFAFFGGLLWFTWDQGRRMERLNAEEERRRREAEQAGGADAP